MLKPQIYLVAGAGILVLGLLALPKVVVKNPSGVASQEVLNAKQLEKNNEMHTTNISDEEKKHLQVLKNNLMKATKEKEEVQWTDSLIAFYKTLNQWDSAAFYAEKLAIRQNNEATWLKAAENYFEAFTFALDSNKVSLLGQKSYQAYEKVLEKNENNLLAQTKMGVIYKHLNPQAPMKGIQMVSAVVRKDPKNELALFYLGTFFAERGAFAEAIERFEQVVSLNPRNPDAWIYLAQCYEESNKPEKVKGALEKVLGLEIAPEIKKEIEKKIKSIK
ncbi:MAG: tetratricopeptide repeat protein [Raineya sp.]